MKRCLPITLGALGIATENERVDAVSGEVPRPRMSADCSREHPGMPIVFKDIGKETVPKVWLLHPTATPASGVGTLVMVALPVCPSNGRPFASGTKPSAGDPQPAP